jgi:hypothetical protein
VLRSVWRKAGSRVGTAGRARCRGIVWRKVLVCLVLVSACTSAAPTAVSLPTALAPLPTAPLPDAFADKPRVPAGTDLVYLERAWEPKDNLSVIGMPAGTLLRRIDTTYPRALLVDKERGFGYYSAITTAGERTRAVVQRIDLATGASTMRIDAGDGRFGNALYSDPRHHAHIVLSGDGQSLAVVRPGVDGDESATRIQLFDALTGAPLADATFAGMVGTVVDPGVGVGSDRVQLQRTYYSGCNSSSCSARAGSADPLWLDAHLRPIVPMPGPCAGGRLIPSGATLVNHCSQRPMTLGFFDANTLAENGRVEVSSGQYPIRSWNIAPDGTVHLISDGLELFRVDGARRRLLDGRLIRMDTASWRIPFGPSVAIAKMPAPDPAVQFSPDGRLAYLTSWRHFPLAHLLPEDGVVVVDLASASVTARFRLPGNVQAIHLSPDGARLYALVAEGSEDWPRWLYALDAADGRTLARVDVLGERYLRISAVATAP